jgi:hypothetical protein
MATGSTGKPCPACGHQNSDEADVCLFCGSPLEKAGKPGTTSTMKLEKARQAKEEAFIEAPDVPPPAKGIAIYIAGDIKPLAVLYDDQFVLGRASSSGKDEEESTETVIDLRPFGALEMGVSRRHLLVRRAKDGYEAVDLDSVNGTYLYEERMSPGRAYRLFNGALIRMGNFRVFITFRFREE